MICFNHPMSYLKDWVKRWASIWSLTWTSNLVVAKLISFPHFKMTSLIKIYKAPKPFWLSNWVSEPVAARSDCQWLRNALCLHLPIQPAKAAPERGPNSFTIGFAIKTFACLLDKLSWVMARSAAGAWTWTQTWSLELCRLNNEL